MEQVRKIFPASYLGKDGKSIELDFEGGRMMKKGIRIVGIAIICIGIIVGYYYYLSNHGKKDVENSTEISKVDEALSRDLAKDYPPTPREVVKFYNKSAAVFL